MDGKHKLPVHYILKSLDIIRFIGGYQYLSILKSLCTL